MLTRMEILTQSQASVGAGSNTWQQHLKSAIRDAQSLRKALGLPEIEGNASDRQTDIESVASSFPVFAPLPFVARMRHGDPLDPLLLQCLPQAVEASSPAGFSPDPLDESDAVLTAGVLKKYAGRALMIVTGACAVHCRYCFRRHFPYQEHTVETARWENALATVASDDSIEEVILSGGDPLTLVDASLAKLLQRLERIDHVRRIRIHTRLPIMIPARVTGALTDLIANSTREQVIVIHANHANEFDADVDAAVARLRDAGAMLLNQSVLLRGINDSAAALIALSRRLLASGVLPYYLHQLDRVQGAAHFEVEEAEGIALIAAMREALPGFAVPRYVREEPGKTSKTVIA